MTTADPTSYAGATTGLNALTTVHLVLIALFAALAVFAIWYGIRLRARRKAGEAVVRERNETFHEATPPPTEAPVAGETVERRLPEEVGRIAPEPAEHARAAEPAASPVPSQLVRAEEPDALSPLADEPIAAAAPMDASPAALAADLDRSPSATSAPSYRLTDLKGLGPKVEARLVELGIVSVANLAALSDADAAALNAQLGPFAGRMERDRWREQARFLAAGDRAGFEASFGKL